MDEVENVIELYIMAASVFLLAILLTILPFRLTWKGKTIVLLSGTALSLFTYKYSLKLFGTDKKIVGAGTGLNSGVVSTALDRKAVVKVN
jgi:hypothetical protein